MRKLKFREVKRPAKKLCDFTVFSKTWPWSSHGHKIHLIELFNLNQADYRVMNRTGAWVHLKKRERRTKPGLRNLASNKTPLAFLLFAGTSKAYSWSTKISRVGTSSVCGRPILLSPVMDWGILSQHGFRPGADRLQPDPAHHRFLKIKFCGNIARLILWWCCLMFFPWPFPHYFRITESSWWRPSGLQSHLPGPLQGIFADPCCPP